MILPNSRSPRIPSLFAPLGLIAFGLLASAPTSLWALDQIAAIDGRSLSVEHIAERAKGAWDSGAVARAFELLDQGLRDYPDAPALYKLHGDLLAATRRHQEAVEAYDHVLSAAPDALDVRWAKWSVLLRSGEAAEAIAELKQIAHLDNRNPLVHLQLAHELRKLDRLEESLTAYQQAVALAPELLGWRLGLARARFDLLDYAGAEGDIRYVLDRIAPGSPLEVPAQNLLTAVYSSQDRGRRFEPQTTPDATAPQLREWADTRGEAWNHYSAGRFQEAEPLLRKSLELNPKDPTATHQLGITLMHLGRCKEAVPVFRHMSNQDASDDAFADAVFRMGQCLVELEQWEDAFVQFQTLYDAAVEFEEANKGLALPPDTRVLDKAKLERWLERVRPHVPELAQAAREGAAAPAAQEKPGDIALTEEVLLRRALERLKPQKALDTRATLEGRDTDFSWFRYVVPAAKVARDDSPTGAHEFIPLGPSDTFAATQPHIYLVFTVVTASYDEVPLSARCFVEATETVDDSRPVAQDRVIMSMNDQSGYFLVSAPPTGWTPGLYRCGLYAGERTSAYNHVDEIRFRIIAPSRRS